MEKTFEFFLKEFEKLMNDNYGKQVDILPLVLDFTSGKSSHEIGNFRFDVYKMLRRLKTNSEIDYSEDEAIALINTPPTHRYVEQEPIKIQVLREPVRQDLFNGLLLFLKDEQVYQMTNVSTLVFNFFTTDDTPTTISILKTLDNLKTKQFIEAELREDGTTSITKVNKQGQDFIERNGWTLRRYYVWAAITPDGKRFLKTHKNSTLVIDNSKHTHGDFSPIGDGGSTFANVESKTKKINKHDEEEKQIAKVGLKINKWVLLFTILAVLVAILALLQPQIFGVSSK